MKAWGVNVWCFDFCSLTHGWPIDWNKTQQNIIIARLLGGICKLMHNTVKGEWLQYETISRWSLTTVWLNWKNGLLRLINSMVYELIRPVSYIPGRSQKLIKLEISSCRCSQLECNEESDETESYSALNTPLHQLVQPPFKLRNSKCCFVSSLTVIEMLKD